MRHSYLLLSCFLADVAVSTLGQTQFGWNIDSDGLGTELIRRASLNKQSEPRQPRRVATGSSTSQDQASSSKASSSKATSNRASSSGPSSNKASSSAESATQWLQSQAPSGQIPVRQSYGIHLPIDRSSSSGSDSRSGSPTFGFGRSSRSMNSRDASPIPPTKRPSAIRSNAMHPFGIPTGPMRVTRMQQPRRAALTSPRPIIESTTQRSPSPPRSPSPSRIPNIISGHPNSAMVLVRGPGWMQVQKSDGVSEVANVPPGKWDYINDRDRQGLFAVGRVMDGGYAVAATTGNAAAGYVAVGHGGRGQVETHDGPSFSYTEVEQGKEFRKHVRGDGTGSVKGAAVASVEGHGQVTAVAMYREVEQPNL